MDTIKNKTPKLMFFRLEKLISYMEIGPLPSEQGRSQRISFDIELGIPEKYIPVEDTAADLVESGFDVGIVRQIILNLSKEKWVLLEKLGERICDEILKKTVAETIELSISKPHTWADTGSLSLRLTRSR